MMPADGHAAELLSALVDGELVPADAEAVQAHVVACADCAAELASVREARAAVRTLPAVEPPAGFFEALLAGALGDEPAERDEPAKVVPLQGRRAAIANAAAAVAAGILLVLAYGGNQAQAVAPPVDGVLQQHASAISAGFGGSGQADGASGDLPKPFVAPAQLAGYRLQRATRIDGGLQLLYAKGRFALTVFEQEGELDFGGIGYQGDRMRVGDDDGWRWAGDPDGRVVVLERGGLVVTLVGEESGQAVLAAAEALPGSREVPLGTRLRRACGEALRSLSPAG